MSAISTNRRCFVIMPFSGTEPPRTQEYWDFFFSNYIQNTMQELGYTCEKAGPVAGNIIQGIISQLFNEDLIIAVLTDKNPNVFYELGARHVLARGTVMIIEKSQKIPFDLSGDYVVCYDDSEPGRHRFKEELAKILEKVHNKSGYDNPIGHYFYSSETTLLRVSKSVENTPLSVSQALLNASNEVVFIGQNLYGMAHGNGVKDLVFKALLEKPQLSVKMLIADPLFDAQVMALSTSIDEAMAHQFPEIIERFSSWNIEWARLCPDQSQRLVIHKSQRVGNVSGTILDCGIELGDSTSEYSMILIRPILYHSQPNLRPCIWLRRSECPHIFDSYLSAFRQIWSHGKPLV